MLTVKCPTCGTQVPYTKENPWRPFCSQRCRLIDLGEWASGNYRIEGEPGSAARLAPEELEALALEALTKRTESSAH